MNSLMLIGASTLVVVALIFLVVFMASRSGEQKERAENAERNLELIRRFQHEISKPIVRGHALVARMRSRLQDPSND